MGNRKRAAKKTRKDVEDSEVEHLGTVVPEQQLLEDTEHQSEQLQNDADKETQPLRDEEQPENTDAEAADPVDDNEAEAADPVDDNEAELPAANNEQETHQPNRKKQRGPTRMKHIAKEPNTREKVEYNEMGEAVGPGSVKLSSYVGCLVREHIPVIFADWRLVNEELKTVLWRSIKARFELDEEYQRTAVMAQMGCLWRSFKSRVVTKIRNATTNKERMDLRPKNVTSVNDWRRFVRAKTSHSFKVVSDKFKARRKKQIPHTSSRKGMVRLREEMKKECPDPSKVTRLQVWVKSRTKKDGTPVNTIAAEKIIKAAELESDAPSTTTNPNSDGLSQLLGADNPGRLRAMGRGMSKSKLSILQVNSKCMAEMKKQQVSLQRKVEDLQVVIEHLKRGEPETGENSARSVTNRAHPKCLLLDYTGTGEIVAEGRVMSSDPEDFVNGIPLGPDALRVLVESAIKEDACLWRPATNILNMEQAVGEMIAWPNTDCIFPEDNAPKSPKTNAPNKCTLKNWRGNEEVIIAEGRWESKEPEALV